jgi:hypothetical protein
VTVNQFDLFSHLSFFSIFLSFHVDRRPPLHCEAHLDVKKYARFFFSVRGVIYVDCVRISEITDILEGHGFLIGQMNFCSDMALYRGCPSNMG